MNTSIVLDQPANVSLTNLDIVSGRVVIRTPRATDVESILVKLEGESRTRLMSSPGPNGERPKPQMEYHKLLYKIQQVFPPSEVVESRTSLAAKAAYTLPPGHHEYTFSFKLPFNNICSTDRSQIPVVIGFEVARPASHHVKKTLPPTLSGFPGEAEIRYFVKVTVNRKSFFKENPRAYAPFNFFPIEPPRPQPTGSELFARQKHQFQAFTEVEPSGKSKVKNLFSRKGSDGLGAAGEPPSISVDIRLPQPAILTCNSDIPLRIVLQRLNASQEFVYLSSLQVALVGITKIRAHDFIRRENNSWVIMSKSNMGLLVASASDTQDQEIVIDDKLWRGLPLPNIVAPTFDTCNIARAYELEVRIGLTYSGNGSSSAGTKPQLVVLPLRLDVQVFSGIAPPAEVLARMAAAEAGKAQPAAATRRPHRKPVPAPPVPSASSGGAATAATNPVADKLELEARRNSGFGMNQVPIDEEPQASHHHGDPDEYGDAPPSYEDAIASDLPPVQAPRPQYAPPPMVEDDVLRDEKGKWTG